MTYYYARALGVLSICLRLVNIAGIMNCSKNYIYILVCLVRFRKLRKLISICLKSAACDWNPLNPKSFVETIFFGLTVFGDYILQINGVGILTNVQYHSFTVLYKASVISKKPVYCVKTLGITDINIPE